MNFKEGDEVVWDGEELLEKLTRMSTNIGHGYRTNIKKLSGKRSIVMNVTPNTESIRVFIPLPKDFPIDLWDEEFQSSLPAELRGKGVAFYVLKSVLRRQKTLTFRRDTK